MDRSKALAALAALANDSRLSLIRLLVQRGDTQTFVPVRTLER